MLLLQPCTHPSSLVHSIPLPCYHAKSSERLFKASHYPWGLTAGGTGVKEEAFVFHLDIGTSAPFPLSLAEL